MQFLETPLPGVVLIELDRAADERGFFARTWCEREFRAAGLNPQLRQCSLSYSRDRFTLRGLHYQAPPCAETKVVRCITGAVFDVVLDLRPDSPAFLRHHAVELSAARGNALYVPEGCAHGFLTLEEGAEVFYQMSAFYVPEAARGVRWDDPAFDIRWPAAPRVLSQRDRTYPDFRPAEIRTAAPAGDLATGDVGR